MSNFILGGRMGDLIHQLYVIKNTPGDHDVYITDRRDLHSDGFIYPLQRTIQELTPVLMYQDYINSVRVYDGEVTESVSGEWINLNMWRRYAYSASWTPLLSRVFNIPATGGAWMRSPADVRYEKLVHCSIPQPRRGTWDGVDLTGGVFIGTMEEHARFNRLELPLITPHSLKQMISLIGSCGQFIGNQSLPLAVAHALDVPRIGVLNEIDAKAYVGEEKIYNRFKYVL